MKKGAVAILQAVTDTKWPTTNACNKMASNDDAEIT